MPLCVCACVCVCVCVHVRACVISVDLKEAWYNFAFRCKKKKKGRILLIGINLHKTTWFARTQQCDYCFRFCCQPVNHVFWSLCAHDPAALYLQFSPQTFHLTDHLSPFTISLSLLLSFSLISMDIHTLSMDIMASKRFHEGRNAFVMNGITMDL